MLAFGRKHDPGIYGYIHVPVYKRSGVDIGLGSGAYLVADSVTVN
jgi:hypothetical protein